MTTAQTGLARITPKALDHGPIREFIARSLSPATQDTYARTLRAFFVFVGWIDPRHVSPEDVRRWRDELLAAGLAPRTVVKRLAIVRSCFDYLAAVGLVAHNPASSKLVPPPKAPAHLTGRALSERDVRYLLAGPDRSTPAGARDYALMLLMVRTAMRAAEVCGLRVSSLRREPHECGTHALVYRAKGGVDRKVPVPDDVYAAIVAYLRSDAARRQRQHCDGPDAALFQPTVNYRRLVFDKPLSTRMVREIVAKWAAFGGVDKGGAVTPHDLRRTPITKALREGWTIAAVMKMSGHRDPRNVMRYNHDTDSLTGNPIASLSYDPPKGAE